MWWRTDSCHFPEKYGLTWTIRGSGKNTMPPTVRYCSTKIYGRIAGVALRLLKNERDAQGNQVPLFERLDRVREMDRTEFLSYADHTENADDLFSFIEIDADENVIRLVWAIRAEVRDWTRAAQVPGRKVCRLKGLCCFLSLNPENTAWQSRAGGQKCITFSGIQQSFMPASGKVAGIPGILEK